MSNVKLTKEINKIMTNLIADYCEFCTIRQNTFYEKQLNPNYVNAILGTNKFTNVYRLLDRVSQYELQKVIYSGIQDPLEILFRVFVFNHFKTECFYDYLLTKEFNVSLNTFNAEVFITLLSEYSGDLKLFTNAYMIPGKRGEAKIITITRKIINFIENSKLFKNLQSGYEIFHKLKCLDGMGDFLASQVVFDCLWHESFKDVERLYALGVGAKRGAFKLGLTNKLNTSYDEGFKALLTAKQALGESNFTPLTIGDTKIYPDFSDIQNTFCEVDKYFRIIHPEIITNKKQTEKQSRIKNKYKPGKSKFDIYIPGWFVSKSGLIKYNL